MGAYGLWPVQAVLGVVVGGLLALNGLWLGQPGVSSWSWEPSPRS